MNPLDMKGPDFLALYAVLLVIAFFGGGFLRWFLRQPSGEPTPEMLELKPYEMAYLTGGAERVADAAIAQLIHRGVLVLDAANRKLTRAEGASAKFTSHEENAVEKYVYDGVPASEGASIRTVQTGASAVTLGIKRRLEELGLVVDSWQASIARFVPYSAILVVFGLGLVKFLVGISRHKPVMFLLFMGVGALIFGSAFLRPVLRSRLGDNVFKKLKYQNAAMQYVYSRGSESVAPNDLLLAMGLFGAGVLAGSPMADLQKALIPPSSGSSGGCGGSSCGGGCGGGGCGGCGG